MKKAQRFIGEFLPLVDAVLFVLDARIPGTSRNRDLEGLIAGKKLIFVLNKADLAEKRRTEQWIDSFSSLGHHACSVSSKSGEGYRSLRNLMENQRQMLLSARKGKGRIDTQIRLMVMGVPNVGKSSLINKLGQRSSAKVGKKPGVTRSYQWVKATEFIHLLDLPGIFVPRLASVEDGLRCASLGIVKEEVLPVEEVALYILGVLAARRILLPGTEAAGATYQGLEGFGREKGFLHRDNTVDIRRTALFLIKHFREGGYGPCTLELPLSSAEGSPSAGSAQ